MKTVRTSIMLAVAASLFCVPLTFGQTPVSDAEFKCQSKATAASSKFVGSKSKCVTKCFANHWKDPVLTPASDCYPPYGGVTSTCIFDALKGAEAKFTAATAKNCDQFVKPTLGCPACYNPGNDCSAGGYAGDYTQTIEGQIDSFVPGVGCELVGPPTKEEQKCQTNTAKALVKQVGGVVKCYIKCMTNARKGLFDRSLCLPPATETATALCIQKVSDKAVLGVNKLCSGKHAPPTVDALPDCPGENDYNDGATWVNLVDLAISGNIPSNFCENP